MRMEDELDIGEEVTNYMDAIKHLSSSEYEVARRAFLDGLKRGLDIARASVLDMMPSSAGGPHSPGCDSKCAC